jgi:hypothetical protein
LFTQQEQFMKRTGNRLVVAWGATGNSVTFSLTGPVLRQIGVAEPFQSGDPISLAGRVLKGPERQTGIARTGLDIETDPQTVRLTD